MNLDVRLFGEEILGPACGIYGRPIIPPPSGIGMKLILEGPSICVALCWHILGRFTSCCIIMFYIVEFCKYNLLFCFP